MALPPIDILTNTKELSVLQLQILGSNNLIPSFFELVSTLFGRVVVVNAVINWLVVSSVWFTEIFRHRFTVRNVTLMVLVFGLASIYGTYSGVDISGAVANTSELAPMIAGLVGGPLIGLAVGLIGGIHRYFLGGLTALPCSLTIVLSGLIAGLIYVANKREFIGTVNAVVFVAFIELLHMLLTLALSRPFSEAISVVERVGLPMIIANCLGMLIFGVILSNYKRRNESQLSRSGFP